MAGPAVNDAAGVEPSEQPSAEAVTEAQPSEAASSAPSADADAGILQVAAAQNETAVEPVLIDVWRPGRAEGNHRPRQRHRDRRPKRGDAAPRHPPETALVAAPVGEAPPPAEQIEPAGPRVTGPVATGAAATDAIATDALPPKQERHPRHRRRHSGEHRQDYRQDRPQQRDRDRPPVKRFERREKAPDPNSPFAKLAALKAQLEADAKERR